MPIIFSYLFSVNLMNEFFVLFVLIRMVNVNAAFLGTAQDDREQIQRDLFEYLYSYKQIIFLVYC